MESIREDLLIRGIDAPLRSMVFALGWLAVMLACSAMADWLASRWTKKKPNLAVFRGIQQSRVKLVTGIVIA